MKVNLVTWIAVVGILCALSGPAARGDEYLPAEYAVGQGELSSADLAVTVPPPAPESLGLRDAVSLSFRHNAGFRSTIRSLLGARSAWWVARQRWDLALFGEVVRTGNGETTETSSAGANLFYSAITGADFSIAAELADLDAEEREQSISASIRQPLLAGRGPASAAYEELRQARNSYRQGLLSFFTARQDLIQRVINSYFGALRREQVLTIQESSVKLAEQAVSDAELRLESGLIAEIDLTRAQLRLAQAQASEVLARQEMQDSLDQLLGLLGLAIGGQPKLVTAAPYEPIEADMEATVAEALARRPELRLSQLDIENRAAARRLARSRRLPSLDLFGGYARTSNGATDNSWDVGVALSVPIGSRGLSEAVRRAQWDLLVAEQGREDLQQQIIGEARSQVRAVEAAERNVAIAAQRLEVAKRSLHIANRMVEEGLATNRDVIDAQNDLTTSDISLVTSQIERYLARVRLQRAVGRDLWQALPSQEPEDRPSATEAASGEAGAEAQ